MCLIKSQDHYSVHYYYVVFADSLDLVQRCNSRSYSLAKSSNSLERSSGFGRKNYLLFKDFVNFLTEKHILSVVSCGLGATALEYPLATTKDP